jgi:ferredoxin
MPGGDGTGPAGLGPTTGRAASYGAGCPVDGNLNLVPHRGFWGWGRKGGRGRGTGRGGGRRAGKGRGLGRGMGRGRGMMPSSGTVPPRQIGEEEVSVPRTPPPPASRSGNDQELKGLKAQARAAEQELRATNENVVQTQAGGRRPSSLVAAVDTARCTGCGACAEVCPMEAITVDATATIETSSCTGCGLCVDECPQEAITLKRI